MNKDSFTDKNAPNADGQTFLTKCEPKLKALEKIRKAKLKVYNYRKKLAVPIAGGLLPFCGFIDYWLLGIQSGNDDSIAGITFIAMGVLWSWVNKPKRQYTKAFKKEILPDLAKLFGDFEYKAGGKIDMSVMKPSKIIPHHTRYKSEDYFKGDYKGVGIEFCEMKLTKKKRSGKKTRTVTVFKGLAVRLKLNHKKFLGHTILGGNRNKLAGPLMIKGTKLKKANLVDPKFEKIFDVYTNDQMEARYLIDPKMIEDMKRLYIEHKGEKIAAAFYEKQMLILISSKHNHFEPADIHTKATSPESILSMKSEIEKILSLVDKLSLYDPKQATQDEGP